MTPLQKLELRRSELRSGIAELTELETRSAEQNAQLDKLSGEYRDSEPEYRAALTTAEAYMPDAEAREYSGLEMRAADPRTGWLARLSSRGEEIPDGPVAEYRQHHGLREDEFPTAWLMGRDRLETRADVATPGPSAQQVAQPYLSRVFKPAVGMAYGMSPMMVPSAEANFPVLTEGATAAMVAKDARQESTAGSWEVETLLPKEARGRITVRSADLATYPTAESALRADLGMQLDDLISAQVQNGSGTGAEVQGIATALSAATAPSSVVTFNGFQAMLSNLVDGTYAASLSDLMVVFGLGTWRKALVTEKSTQSDAFALDWLQSKTMITMSDHVAAPASDAQRVFACKSRGKTGSYAWPMWMGTQVIRDQYSDAGHGWIHVTANLRWNFKIIRAANFGTTTLKIA